jgi:hypothetical protein
LGNSRKLEFAKEVTENFNMWVEFFDENSYVNRNGRVMDKNP